jgi:hypothetical protein
MSAPGGTVRGWRLTRAVTQGAVLCEAGGKLRAVRLRNVRTLLDLRVDERRIRARRAGALGLLTVISSGVMFGLVAKFKLGAER